MAADESQTGGKMAAASPYLHGGTVILLLSGGAMGQSAYDSLRDEISGAKVEIATTRQSVESLKGWMVDHESRPHAKSEESLERLRMEVLGLERRLARAETKLEMIEAAQIDNQSKRSR